MRNGLIIGIVDTLVRVCRVTNHQQQKIRSWKLNEILKFWDKEISEDIAIRDTI
jgi:hypothetical protein